MLTAAAPYIWGAPRFQSFLVLVLQRMLREPRAEHAGNCMLKDMVGKLGAAVMMLLKTVSVTVVQTARCLCLHALFCVPGLTL